MQQIARRTVEQVDGPGVLRTDVGGRGTCENVVAERRHAIAGQDDLAILGELYDEVNEVALKEKKD